MPVNNSHNQIGSHHKSEYYNNLEFQDKFLEEIRNAINNGRLQSNHGISEKWVELMTERALETFCSNNGVISSRNDNIAELQNLYKTLWQEIAEELKSENIDFETIQKLHLNRLSNWLFETRSFIQDIHDPQSIRIREFARSGLTVDFQVNLMHMDIKNMPEPVLDLGCGKEAHLVHYLRDLGKQAFGMDKQIIDAGYLINSDWLNFDFQPHTWGTIIANLSFALYFTGHYHQKDGQYILYARKYMEILNSLKKHGSFCYTPGLPFIEAYLPKDKFKTENHRINEEFSCTRITAL